MINLLIHLSACCLASWAVRALRCLYFVSTLISTDSVIHSTSSLKVSKKSSEMCYSASGSDQSYTHPASCFECVNRGKMLFCFCCCDYLLCSNNVNSVMSPITSGMHHMAFPLRSACPEGECPWHHGAPTVLIRLHVSLWHQLAALT